MKTLQTKQTRGQSTNTVRSFVLWLQSWHSRARIDKTISSWTSSLKPNWLSFTHAAMCRFKFFWWSVWPSDASKSMLRHGVNFEPEGHFGAFLKFLSSYRGLSWETLPKIEIGSISKASSALSRLISTAFRYSGILSR